MPLHKARVATAVPDAVVDTLVSKSPAGLTGNSVLLLSQCIKKLADLSVLGQTKKEKKEGKKGGGV